MNKLKLIAFASVLCFLTSCDPDNELEWFPGTSRYVSNVDFNMTSSQQIPANSSTATGSIYGTYDRKTKTFSYTIEWQNLSSNIATNGIHIHGIADRGANAIPAGPIASYPGGVVQTVQGVVTSQRTGKISTSLYVDGVAVREQDLLGGKFYIDIHTVNFPGGEIRGQILFPQ